MPEIELSAGVVEYQDTGGHGPVLVFLHGLLMDGTVWRKVVASLRADYRCVLPTLPLGGHRRPMRPDADLSLHGMALLVGEFLEKAGLAEVTLVVNDWGGAQILLAEGRTERIARAARTGDPDGGQDPRRDLRHHATAPVPCGQAGSGRLGLDEQAPRAPRDHG